MYAILVRNAMGQKRPIRDISGNIKDFDTMRAANNYKRRHCPHLEEVWIVETSKLNKKKKGG